MLGPFKTVPYVVVTPAIKVFLLVLHHCNFVTVMNNKCLCSSNCFRWPCQKVVWPPDGLRPTGWEPLPYTNQAMILWVTRALLMTERNCLILSTSLNDQWNQNYGTQGWTLELVQVPAVAPWTLPDISVLLFPCCQSKGIHTCAYQTYCVHSVSCGT